VLHGKPRIMQHGQIGHFPALQYFAVWLMHTEESAYIFDEPFLHDAMIGKV
jgi:hypothetical protein